MWYVHLIWHWLDDLRAQIGPTFSWDSVRSNIGASAWLVAPAWFLIEWRIAVRDEKDHRSKRQILSDMLHPHAVLDAEKNVAHDVVEELQQTTQQQHKP